ncbi:MAG TPA: DUF4389 domain-containing protein [Chloroflexota bacterium]|nr:DUF4389 domain-containing protein [Chloroflexota bacterium]
MAQIQPRYPVNLTVDYPEQLDRLTTLFRLFTVIPIAILLWLVYGARGYQAEYVATGFLFLPTLLMLLFRQKYPRWWFDWNVALVGFSLRVSSYGALLRDEYPSTDDEQSVHLNIPYPNAETDLNRWLPLVKWLLAIPHYIVLVFLEIGVLVAIVVAWFAILITRRYPRALFDYVVGVFRWSIRVTAYAFLLTIDQYPPFTLSE